MFVSRAAARRRLRVRCLATFLRAVLDKQVRLAFLGGAEPIASDGDGLTVAKLIRAKQILRDGQATFERHWRDYFYGLPPFTGEIT